MTKAAKLFTKPELKMRGLRPKNGERPAAIEEKRIEGHGWTKRFLWRLNQAVPMRSPK